MQRFSQRESVLLGYSPQKTFMDSNFASEDVDVDFSDVFGGPPRRTSIQESRYSFSEQRVDSSEFKRSEESVGSSRNPWSGKPVFGEEGLNNRRRNSRNDFFDDIFRGNGSLSSSPRKYELKDPFASGSQLSSPVRPLPPKAEPFGSSHPAQFSLPAKMNRGMDLPTFGSPTRSNYKSKGSSSNGSSNYTFSPLSRFSGNQGEEEVRNDFQSSYRFGGLSPDLPGIEDSTNTNAHDGNETRCNPKCDSNSSNFHFSIYKWADKGGVPLPIPLRGSERLKEKDKLPRCSSANGWIACETQVAMEPKANLQGTFGSSEKVSRYGYGGKSFRVEHEKNEIGSLIDSRNEGREQDSNPMESEVIRNLKSTEKNVSVDVISHSSGNEGKAPHTVPQIDDDIQEKEVSASGKKTKKPLSLFFDDDDDEQDNNQKPTHSGSKETPEKNPKKLSETLDGKSIKKQDVKRAAAPKFNNVEAIKTSVKRSPRNSWDNGKGRVKGKVKEFIKIFNQDASSNPQTDTVSESYNSREKERGTIKPEKEPSINMNRNNEKKNHKANLQKKKTSSDIPVANYIPKGASEKKINSSIKDTVSDDSKIIVEDPVESLDDNFLIQDLTLEDKTLTQFGIALEEIQAIDAKIRQWSNGKQGNIRSLLSTLQYVLWPDSGWKPVPLVDIIEGPSVKRSYQKALLSLHPDKLQQKGAASDQKYIAEKVFDILQDAWTHFNSLGGGV